MTNSDTTAEICQRIRECREILVGAWGTSEQLLPSQLLKIKANMIVLSELINVHQGGSLVVSFGLSQCDLLVVDVSLPNPYLPIVHHPRMLVISI